MRKSTLIGVVAIALTSTAAMAVQFPYLDPSYTQEIYTGPLVGGPGMAWTTGGAMLTRNGSQILQYSLTQNAVHQGTNIHASTNTYTVPGLSTSGYGLVRALDGLIYTPTASGLQRFNPSNFAAPAQSLAGTVGGQGYGITMLADGRIVYCAGAGTNEIYVYNISSGSNSLIYTSPGLIDDIEAGPGGMIALAGQALSEIIVINSSGSVLSQFATAHYPDGLAFGDGTNTNAIFSNNNDGTISRFSWSSGISGLPSSTVNIATGSGAYGDLAAVGPDCAFYVTQFDNFGYHGSTWGVGTNWDNATTNNEPSIVRIGATGADGLPECGFYNVYTDVPEPATAATLTMASVGLLIRRRWPRQL